MTIVPYDSNLHVSPEQFVRQINERCKEAYTQKCVERAIKNVSIFRRSSDPVSAKIKARNIELINAMILCSLYPTSLSYNSTITELTQLPKLPLTTTASKICLLSCQSIYDPNSSMAYKLSMSISTSCFPKSPKYGNLNPLKDTVNQGYRKLRSDRSREILELIKSKLDAKPTALSLARHPEDIESATAHEPEDLVALGDPTPVHPSYLKARITITTLKDLPSIQESAMSFRKALAELEATELD